VTHFRPFRNSDPPALVRLWNRGSPASAAARPLSVHEFDTHVLGGPCFDRAGLIVAERDGRAVGFAHAGFGPEEPTGRPLSLSYAMGAVAMLVVEPEVAAPGLERGLLEAAEDYLLSRGASVIYAGGQFPLNPIYWGVYGGSEWAGVLGSHSAFQRAVAARGYEPVAATVLLEADLTEPEPRDPRSVLVKRQTTLSTDEDAMPPTWWHNLAVGEFHPTAYRLLSRVDQTELARATTWDMSWFGRGDGRSRVGLIDVEVHPDRRRQGYGRHLVSEILRQARAQETAVATVQTRATNTPALALYEALGFRPVETATLFRLPGGAATAPLRFEPA
jgi:ribosomal protein S18 acetylase RimI-like enzyme